MPAAGALLLELTVRGIELQAHGDRLRYRPRSAMTPELTGRVRRHKSEILARLQSDRASEPTENRQSRPVSSVAPEAGWSVDRARARGFTRRAPRAFAYRIDGGGCVGCQLCSAFASSRSTLQSRSLTAASCASRSNTFSGVSPSHKPIFAKPGSVCEGRPR